MAPKPGANSETHIHPTTEYVDLSIETYFSVCDREGHVKPLRESVTLKHRKVGLMLKGHSEEYERKLSDLGEEISQLGGSSDSDTENQWKSLGTRLVILLRKCLHSLVETHVKARENNNHHFNHSTDPTNPNPIGDLPISSLIFEIENALLPLHGIPGVDVVPGDHVLVKHGSSNSDSWQKAMVMFVGNKCLHVFLENEATLVHIIDGSLMRTPGQQRKTLVASFPFTVSDLTNLVKERDSAGAARDDLPVSLLAHTDTPKDPYPARKKHKPESFALPSCRNVMQSALLKVSRVNDELGLVYPLPHCLHGHAESYVRSRLQESTQTAEDQETPEPIRIAIARRILARRTLMKPIPQPVDATNPKLSANGQDSSASSLSNPMLVPLGLGRQVPLPLPLPNAPPKPVCLEAYVEYLVQWSTGDDISDPFAACTWESREALIQDVPEMVNHFDVRHGPYSTKLLCDEVASPVSNDSSWSRFLGGQDPKEKETMNLVEGNMIDIPMRFPKRYIFEIEQKNQFSTKQRLMPFPQVLGACRVERETQAVVKEENQVGLEAEEDAKERRLKQLRERIEALKAAKEPVPLSNAAQDDVAKEQAIIEEAAGSSSRRKLMDPIWCCYR